MATLDADDLTAIAALISTTVGLANLVQVDGLTTADGAAILRLRRLEISNDTGDPAFMVANSAGDAMYLSSDDGEGLYCYGYQRAALFEGPDGTSNLMVCGPDAVLQFSPAADQDGIEIRGGHTSGNAVTLTTEGGHGLAIASAGAGSHDVALTGSGDVLGSISLDLTQALADVKTATVGGALNGAHATAWGKVVKDVTAKLLKVFSFGSTTVPAQVFDLDDGSNPTTRTPQ